MGKGGKNPNGSGSISRRKDGRFYAALYYPYYDPASGRMKRKRRSTTKSDWDSAHRWLVKMKADLQGGVAKSAENPTVSGYLSEWLSEVVQPSKAPNTYAKREQHVRVYISPSFGGVRLADLQPRQIHSLYNELSRAGYALSTRRDVHNTLKMALSQAVKWGLVSSNPTDLVDLPRESATDEFEDEVRALTDEQTKTLFRTTAGERWHNYYVTAIRTGLRPGEMLGLQWRDVELSTDPASISVRRTLGRSSAGRKGSYFKAPKSKSSRRTLALHWEAADALTRQGEMVAGEGLAVSGEALVFPNERGAPMNESNLYRRHLAPALERSNLPPLTLHELRHTYASIALYEWRLPQEIVSQTLGHASPTITVSLYGHVAPGAQDSAIRALNALQKRPSEVG